jgi:hypothetical protein
MKKKFEKYDDSSCSSSEENEEPEEQNTTVNNTTITETDAEIQQKQSLTNELNNLNLVKNGSTSNGNNDNLSQELITANVKVEFSNTCYISDDSSIGMHLIFV